MTSNFARQTCHGQPVDVFRIAEYIIVPSGSCYSMISHHFAELFRDDPERLQEAQRLAPCVWDPACAARSSIPVGADYGGPV